jgi:hypothetical protein
LLNSSSNATLAIAAINRGVIFAISMLESDDASVDDDDGVGADVVGAKSRRHERECI